MGRLSSERNTRREGEFYPSCSAILLCPLLRPTLAAQFPDKVFDLKTMSHAPRMKGEIYLYLLCDKME